MIAQYTLQHFSKNIDVDEYITHFRDKERFIELCKACPSYGNSWGCPPFNFDTDTLLRSYKYATIMADKIDLKNNKIPIEKAHEIIFPHRIKIDKRLLEMEKKYNGRAFAYIGKCLYCNTQCKRIHNLPCLHPDKVRPSLEAFGFNIETTLSELFGIKLLWGMDNYLPKYLVLVSGLFHNHSDVVEI